MKERRTILICRGSRCRKALARSDRLQRALGDLPVEPSYVRCQKVCDGPVVGLEIEGRWEWFGRMDSPKALAALPGLVEADELAKPLRKRRSRKRSNKRKA